MLGPGRKPAHANIFSELNAYFKDLRQQHRRVLTNMMFAKFKELSKDTNRRNSLLRHRVYRRMARSDIVNRRIAHRAQNTRHCATQILNFVAHVNEQMKRYDVPRDCVYNIDETNVDFNIESSSTLNRRSDRNISVTSRKSM